MHRLQVMRVWERPDRDDTYNDWQMSCWEADVKPLARKIVKVPWAKVLTRPPRPS